MLKSTKFPALMLITVVIPTYNRRKLLAQCLDSLFRQTYPCTDFEIVIVVDGGTDDTSSYLREVQFPCAKQIIEQPNRGQAAARNAGIRAACGKYVLLLDDDFVCAPTLIEEHVKAQDGSRSVVVGPIVHDASHDNIPAVAIDREIVPFYRRLASGAQEAWLPPNSSLERDVLLDCGGYDEEFSRAREDTDLGLRLQQYGMRFRYAPSAIVRQHYAKSAGELVASGETFGKHDVMLVRKFPAYVTQSNLSRVSTGSRWRRAFRRIVATTPLSLDRFLSVPYALTALLARNERMCEAAIRLLNLRRYIRWVRGAVHEAGNWKQLAALVESAQHSSGE